VETAFLKPASSVTMATQSMAMGARQRVKLKAARRLPSAMTTIRVRQIFAKAVSASIHLRRPGLRAAMAILAPVATYATASAAALVLQWLIVGAFAGMEL
jgi:hypothetical protein